MFKKNLNKIGFFVTGIAIVILMYVSVLQTEAAEYTTTDAQGVLETNGQAGIYQQPDLLLNPIVTVGEGIPIKVTGITSNGWFRVDVGGEYYMPGVVLKQPHNMPTESVTVTEKQVGNYLMYVCGATDNGTPIYFYREKPVSWYNERMWFYNGSYWYSEYTYKYPGHENDTWPQYLAAALNESGVTPDMSDYEKAVTVANYLRKRVNYDLAISNGSNTTLYTLTNNLAICSGFSNTYLNMMNMLGIECHLICGEAINRRKETGSHVWNKVVIDGIAYYVDVTWNHGTEMYLMKDYQSFSEHHWPTEEYDHTYFTDRIW